MEMRGRLAISPSIVLSSHSTLRAGCHSTLTFQQVLICPWIRQMMFDSNILPWVIKKKKRSNFSNQIGNLWLIGKPGLHNGCLESHSLLLLFLRCWAVPLWAASPTASSASLYILFRLLAVKSRDGVSFVLWHNLNSYLCFVFLNFTL